MACSCGEPAPLAINQAGLSGSTVPAPTRHTAPAKQHSSGEGRGCVQRQEVVGNYAAGHAAAAAAARCAVVATVAAAAPVAACTEQARQLLDNDKVVQVQGRGEALAQGVGKRLPADQGAGCKVHSTSGVQLRLDFLLLLLMLLLLSLPLLLLREGRTRRVASRTRSLAGSGSGAATVAAHPGLLYEQSWTRTSLRASDGTAAMR